MCVYDVESLCRGFPKRVQLLVEGSNLACCCLYIAVLSVCSSTRLAQRWSLVCFWEKVSTA